MTKAQKNPQNTQTPFLCIIFNPNNYRYSGYQTKQGKKRIRKTAQGEMKEGLKYGRKERLFYPCIKLNDIFFKYT